MISKRNLLRTATPAALAMGFKLKPAFAKTEIKYPDFSEAKATAEEGFIFGLPLVTNYGVMYEFIIDKNSSQYKAPFNILKNEARVFTYKDTAIVSPNSDTPYSSVWLDLRAEPIVLTVPAIAPKRYYSVQLCDSNTYNYGYIGSRATGNDAGNFLVVAPDWQGETPPNIKKVIRSGTPLSIVIFRTQLFDPGDLDSVIEIQAGYKVQPLSSFLNKPPPPPAPAINFPVFSAALAKTQFFEFLDFALQFSPPKPGEAEIRARLAKIGVGPGKTFNFKELPLKYKAEIALGMKAGDEKVEKAVAASGTDINGWRVGSLYGDSAHYNGDWLARAAGTKGGIYGNSAEEAMYPLTRTDVEGHTLDGAKHNYTLTFPSGGLPPVNAFWSITMYDGKTQLLIKNPINRYLINSPMLPNMKTNADGSLTIYIQNKKPEFDKEENWLPAPDGPIFMLMRLYWPKTTPPSILPPGHGTWHPPGVVRSKA
jgi:hypothetical protein